jgi:hypothetical protein
MGGKESHRAIDTQGALAPVRERELRILGEAEDVAMRVDDQDGLRMPAGCRIVPELPGEGPFDMAASCLVRSVSRRGFLIGAGVSVAGGLAYGADRLLARGNSVGLPRPSSTIDAWPYTFSTFPSRVLGFDVGYALSIPPGHRLGDALPVVFMLPGRGAGAGGCMTSTQMPRFVAHAIRSGGVTPFALAAIDGGESYWHPRTSGEDRMSMLMDEFVPMVADRWSLGVSRAQRAIMGWSMGGYGAILMGSAIRGTSARCPLRAPRSGRVTTR